MSDLADIDLEAGEEDNGGKKSGLMMTLVGAGIATIVAAGAGWFIGGMLAPQSIEMQEAAQPSEEAQAQTQSNNNDDGGDEEVLPEVGAPGPNLIVMQSLTTNIAYPEEKWIRMEVSLVVKETPDDELVELIHQDMLAYLRTLSLQQLQGARGFRYVREDLRERAILRSEGIVENILVRTFVVE